MGKEAKARALRRVEKTTVKTAYLTVPPPVTVKTGQLDRDGKDVTREVTFADFLHDNVLTRMGKTLKDTRRNLAIYGAFVDANEGERIGIEGGYHAEMKEALSGEWNQFLALQLMTFFDAIENAEIVTDEGVADDAPTDL